MSRFLPLFLATVALCNGNLFCDERHGSGNGGDLWFYGFQGQSFPFIGNANGKYMIYSDPSLLINSRFEYAIPHQNDSSDFTIMADIGIKTSSFEIEIKRNSFRAEFASVKVNSQEVKIKKNAKAHQIGDCAHVVYEHDHSIIVITPLHQILVEMKKSHSYHIKAAYLNLGISGEFDSSFAYGGVLGQTYGERNISIDDADFVVKSLFSSSAKDSTYENKKFTCSGEDVKVHSLEKFHMVHQEEKVQKCKEGHFCVSEDGKTFGCKSTGCGGDSVMTCAAGTTCMLGNCLRDDFAPCASDDMCYSGECSDKHTCGCLAADSMILLEDGVTEIRVDSLKIGDRIYTYPKGAVTVEHIYIHPYTGMMYSMDDSTYFFTADHPFPSGDNINKTLLGEVEKMFPKPKIIPEGMRNEILKWFGFDLTEGGNIEQMQNGNVLQYFNKATGSFEMKEVQNLKSVFVSEMPVYTIYFKEVDAPYLSVANGYVNGFHFESGVAHQAFLNHLQTQKFLNDPVGQLTKVPQQIYNLFKIWLML